MSKVIVHSPPSKSKGEGKAKHMLLDKDTLGSRIVKR
jgi:hypothetical protein